MNYRFGSFCLNTERLELRRNDVPVSMEPQVFDVLRLLIEKRDRIVSRDEIIDVVWNGRIVSEATLSSRINAVRRAIGDDGKRQAIIRTLPRRGFRFIRAVSVDGGAVEVGRTADKGFEAEPLLPLPDKPSIAVLPFANLSGDPAQEYFADGVAEDIITVLGLFHWFFVIARNSSFTYRSETVDLREVARALGVQYVLMGSVRKIDERVRISAQLIDTPSGRQIWADRFDRDLHDIFAVQDEIAESIAGAVAPSFVTAEARRIERKAPENFDAWDYTSRGNWHLWRLDRESLFEARRNFEAAIELDPRNSMALAALALACSWQVVWGWAEDPDKIRQLTDEYAQRAVAADEHDAWAHASASTVHLHRRRLNEALRAAHRAIQLNPSLAFGEHAFASASAWRGDFEAALEHTDKAERLSPRDPAHGWFMLNRAVAAFVVGRYEDQVKWAEEMTEAAPDHPAGWRMLAAGYGWLEKQDEAQIAVRGLLRVVPHFTIELARTSMTGIRHEDLKRFLVGLRNAGVPDSLPR